MSEAEANTAHFPRALRFLFDTKMPDGVTPARYKVGYGGRGGAKSWGFARALLMLGAQQPERTLCAREYQISIKQSVHKLIADQVTALKMNYLYEVQQAVIRHREIDTEFFFEGLHGNMDKIKSYERIKRCWLEEAVNVQKDSFEKLDPTLRMEGSEIWASFNPELETDYMFDRFVLRTPADAIVRKLTWRDNPWFSDVLRRQMDAMKKEDYDAYLHVWEGHTKLMLAGAVYAEQLRALRASGRVCVVPYEPTRPVDVVWDLGKRDKTGLWFVQYVGFEIRLLQYYENSQKDLDHYLEYIQAQRATSGQKYIYGTMVLPHDAKAGRLGSKLTIEEQIVAVFGRKNVRVLKRFSIADGINAARTMFPLCYFDKDGTAVGLQHLSHYRHEVLDDNGKLSLEPVHDEHSHAADGFRYIALSRRMPRESAAIVRERLAQEYEAEVKEGRMYEHGGRPQGGGQFGWMRR